METTELQTDKKTTVTYDFVSVRTGEIVDSGEFVSRSAAQKECDAMNRPRPIRNRVYVKRG
jgi:hypothetical protein